MSGELVVFVSSLATNVATNIASELFLATPKGQNLLDWFRQRPPHQSELESVISEILLLYFEQYPKYNRSGIKQFFLDPIVSKQLLIIILDSQISNISPLEEIFKKHLHSVSKKLLERDGISLNEMMKNFAQCSRVVWANKIDVPGIAVILQIYERVDTFEAKILTLQDSVNEIASKLPLKPSDVGSVTKVKRPYVMTLHRPSHGKFEGRDSIFADLATRLRLGSRIALFGRAGIGKTTLAVKLIDNLVNEFDGLLTANLGASGDTLLTTLQRWAKELNVESRGWEKTEDGLIVLRENIASSKMLLVIDDVSNQEEMKSIASLAGPNCSLLITTRNTDIASGFESVEIESLKETDSKALLVKLAPGILKDQRLEYEIDQLLPDFEGLPHYLVVAGQLIQQALISKSERRIQEVIRLLKQPVERLQQEVGGVSQSLEKALEPSYHLLSPEEQREFRGLGVFLPAPNTVSEESLISVLGSTTLFLNKLIDLALIESASLGREQFATNRYIFHQSNADFASRKLADADPHEVLKFYEAMVRFYVVFLDTHTFDNNLLKIEQKNISNALDIAIERNMPDLLIKGVNQFYEFLQVEGLYSLGRKYLYKALEYVNMLNDKPTRMRILHNLGEIESRSKPEKARDFLQEALEIANSLEEKDFVFNTYIRLGNISENLGDFEAAKEKYSKALDEAQRFFEGDERNHRLGRALGSLSVLEFRKGNLGRARQYVIESISLAKNSPNKNKLIRNGVWMLGVIAKRQGNFEDAEKYYSEAFYLAFNLGDVAGIAGCLQNLGMLAYEIGNLEFAKRYWRGALKWSTDNKERLAELNGSLGRLALKQSQFQDAVGYLTKSRHLAEEIGNLQLQTLGSNSWGEYHLMQNSLDQAWEEFGKSLQIGKSPDAIAEALLGQAKVLVRKGQFPEAEKIAKKSLKLNVKSENYLAAAQVAYFTSNIYIERMTLKANVQSIEAFLDILSKELVTENYFSYYGKELGGLSQSVTHRCLVTLQLLGLIIWDKSKSKVIVMPKGVQAASHPETRRRILADSLLEIKNYTMFQQILASKKDLTIGQTAEEFRSVLKATWGKPTALRHTRILMGWAEYLSS